MWSVLGLKLKTVQDIGGGMVESVTDRYLFANQNVICGTQVGQYRRIELAWKTD